MTRDEISAKVSRNLEDAGTVHFTPDDLNDSIQDGYDLLAIMTGCVEKIATINFEANKTYYDFAAEISDYFKVFAIWNNVNRKWMNPNILEGFKAISPRWSTIKGNMREFAFLGYKDICIYPKPAASTSSMIVFYHAQAPVLSGNTQPLFFPEMHDILVDYATSDLLDQDLEFKKSVHYAELFTKNLANLIQALERRTLPERIYALSCQYSLSLI